MSYHVKSTKTIHPELSLVTTETVLSEVRPRINPTSVGSYISSSSGLEQNMTFGGVLLIVFRFKLRLAINRRMKSVSTGRDLVENHLLFAEKNEIDLPPRNDS
jgi:hypothetical protein